MKHRIMTLRIIVTAALMTSGLSPVITPKPAYASSTQNQTDKLHLSVTGMVCSGCENVISTTLKSLKGVISAKADHKAQTVMVEYQPSSITKQKIVDAINKIGHYKVVS